MTNRADADAATAAEALGWTVTRLRVWRHRHPGILEPVAKGPRGIALYRAEDLRHAQAHIDGECTRSGCNV